MDIKSRAKERKKAKKDEKKLASASEKPINTSPVNEGQIYNNLINKTNGD